MANDPNTTPDNTDIKKKVVGVYDRPASADRGPLGNPIILVVVILAVLASLYFALRHFHVF